MVGAKGTENFPFNDGLDNWRRQNFSFVSNILCSCYQERCINMLYLH